MDYFKSLMALYEPDEDDDFKMGVYPLVDAMCKSLKIPDTIDRVLGRRDERAAMQHSTLVRALIMNMLDERVPLVHLKKELEKVDCEVLFGKYITADLFTEDRLGDTLDALSEMDQCRVGEGLIGTKTKSPYTPRRSVQAQLTHTAPQYHYSLQLNNLRYSCHLRCHV